MLKRVAAFAALLAATACAGVEPAGRSAARAPAPPVASAPVGRALEAPAAEPSVAAPVAAPAVSAPAPASRPASRSGEDEIVIPGQTERQVAPPNGDPRNRIERMEDVRAWDECVTGVQAAFETDPMRPQLETPEDVCSRSLGMASRDAVPDSRPR